MNAKMKKVILDIERKVFRGRLVSVYVYIKENRKKGFFRGKNAVIINEPVSDMILMQYNHQDFFQYQYVDLAVRYLAVENYYGKNDFGFELYRKMHTLGENYGQNNDAERYYQKLRKSGKFPRFGVEKEEHSIEQFQNLIRSYEKNGYDPNSAIISDRNLMNMNGSHRVTLAVYNKQEFMSVQIQNSILKRRFSIDWFWKKGFTYKELDTIKNTLEKLIKYSKEKTGNYYCVLYPPALEYFDEIVNDIGKIDEENIAVVDYNDYVLEVEDFLGMMKMIYSFDSIKQSDLERKLSCILNASDIKDNKVRYRVVEININKPMYRLKSDNGMPESTATVRVKEIIRERYRVRDQKFTKHFNSGYAHDVIIHSTDNFLSNEAFRELYSINKDISSLFRKLGKFKYAVIESGSNKISDTFPKNFYFNDDIDIIVDESQLQEIAEITTDFCKNHFQQNWITVKQEESEYGIRVWIELKERMLIMFDFMARIPEINHNYINECLERIENQGLYNHVNMNDELHFRLAKYMAANNKVWHSEFIEKHSRDFIFNRDAFDRPNKAKKYYQQIVNRQVK